MSSIEILVVLGVVLTVVSKVLPRLDTILAWFLGISLALLAGFRTGGFDYEQYLIIIEHVRSLHGSDLVFRLAAAKDPLFLYIIETVSALTPDPQFVLLAVSVLSVLPKILFSSLFPRNRTFFLALYSVFLAPGLEFAAIRAALGIGFVMLGFASISRVKKTLSFGIAVAAHSSLIVSVAAHLLGRSRILTIATIALTPLVPVVLERYVANFQRLEEYAANQGTLFALALPVPSFFAALMLAQLPHRLQTFTDKEFLILRRATLLSVGVSVILAIPMVTVSFRLLEISWVLLLMMLFDARGTRLSHAQSIYFYIASFLWIFGVVSSNILRSTWVAMALEQL